MLRLNTILFTAVMICCSEQQGSEKLKLNSLSTTAMIVDGPYVLYRNDSVFVKYIEDHSGVPSVRTDSMPNSLRSNIDLHVNTDIPGKTFTVKLKSKLSNEKAEHNGVKKMLVVSDIEGNFEALRKLLQGGQVIDENFNWTFGKDHLVLIGDFVDRGTMVTEVLWFIYALEEKAKAAGGYVHFILGNHEIMNMNNNLHYTHERYLQNAALLNKPYMQLFGEDAEIGRWLGTKNIAERVGNILFAHGGFSSYMNIMGMSLKELNNKTRDYYTDTTFKYADDRLDVVFSDYGPFWYRGYYTQPKATQKQVDSTLEIYGVRYIATGHTVVSKEIVAVFDGKVFNTDVPHAKGHSEALLVDNGKFWRVNQAGEKLDIKYFY